MVPQGLLRGDVADEVVGVTIVPRGAGGHTRFLPRERQLETGLYTRRYLEARMEGAHPLLHTRVAPQRPCCRSDLCLRIGRQ